MIKVYNIRFDKNTEDGFSLEDNSPPLALRATKEEGIHWQQEVQEKRKLPYNIKCMDFSAVLTTSLISLKEGTDSNKELQE